MSASTTITIHIPRELRTYCEGASTLSLSAPNVRAALDELERRYPMLYRGVCDETDTLRRHLNLFVNSTHIRERQGLGTELVPGDILFILPAVSGG